MRMRNVIVAVGLGLVSASALADVVSLLDVTAIWINAVPPPPSTTIVNGPSSSTIFWGVPATASGQSGYTFSSAGGTVNFNVNPPPTSAPPALLGTFVHLNFPIFPPFLQTVQLSISADVIVAGVNEGVRTFLFNFTHDETPNGGPPGGPFTGPCPFGGANGAGINIHGCADAVTVAAGSSTDSFTVNGIKYTLNLLGFSQDGGATIANQFLTIENQTNTAGLYADVSALAGQVPEPGSLALVGLALLGVAGIMRRKSSK
jgi:hypothetical protein